MDAPIVLPAVMVTFVVLFLVATKLSRAGRLSAALKPMIGEAVDIRVWGTPITGFRIHTIRAFGAGLLFLLVPEGGGKPTLLKVAQPQAARHDARQLVIDDARYIQWRSARMPRVDGAPALEVTAIVVS